MTQWNIHCVKYRNLTLFSGVKILWKGTSFSLVSGESPKIMRKLCLSTKFLRQKIGKITVFYVVIFEAVFLRKQFLAII